MTPLRLPGSDERFFIVRNALGYYHSVGMTLYLKMLKISEDSFLSALHNAITRTVKQHPILLVSPTNELKDEVMFSPLPSIKILDVLKIQSRSGHRFNHSKDEELDAELQRQHNIGFETGKPQWRIVLLHDQSIESNDIQCTVSFIYHHALGDGLSGLAFLRCLVRELCTPDFSPPSDTITTNPTPLLPTIEMLRISASQKSNNHNSRSTSLEHAPVQSVPPEVNEGTGKLWLGTIPTNKYPLFSRFISFDIMSEQVQRLRQLCSANHVSITPLLQVIIAKSIFLVLSQEFDVLRGLCSINLRPNLKGMIPRDAIGLYVGGFATKYKREGLGSHDDVEGKSRYSWLWNEVKRTRESMLTAVSREQEKFKQPPSKDDPLAPDMVMWMQQLLGKARVASFDINNLGVFQMDRAVSDSLQVGRIVFSASQSVIGSALKVNVVTGLNGQMTIGLMWQDGIVQDSDIGGIVKNIQEIMDDLTVD